MTLPKSTFCMYAMRNAFFVIGGNIYRISRSCLKNENGTIEISSLPVRLDVLEKVYISDLERGGHFREMAQSRADEGRDMRLARFVAEEVLGSGHVRSEEPDGTAVISKAIPAEGILVRCGVWYRIYEDGNGTVKVNGKGYSAMKRPCIIEDIERRYQRLLDEALFCGGNGLEGKVAGKKYYDKEKGIGFVIENNDFYVFTEVGPYALYERSNGSYYRFGKVRVGSRLEISNGEIEWGKLLVMDSYSHPSLPEADMPYQSVCVGNFDYETIRQRHPGDVRMQVIELMRKGRKVLTTEYTSHDRSWHKLGESIFTAKKLNGGQNVMALNY